MSVPNFYNYLKLIKNDTSYGRRMARLSSRIFGDVSRPTPHASFRVVRMLQQEPIYRQNWITNWYPRHPETASLMTNLRNYGLFRDEHQDFKEEMIRLRTLRGKGPKEKKKDKKDK